MIISNWIVGIPMSFRRIVHAIAMTGLITAAHVAC